MCTNLQRLRALVSERLTAAAEDIFALVERTIAEYEEELRRSKEENQRKGQILEQLLHTSGDSQKPFLHSPSILEPPQCQEEAPEQSTHLHTSVKSEEPSTLQQRQPDDDDDEEEEEWDPPASTSAAQMETEADGDHDKQVQIKNTSGLEFNRGRSSGCAGCEKHECLFCGKKFATRQRLKIHTRIHTGEKPFSCTVCHEAFTAKGHLKDHMRVHTGEKPFSCSVCDRAFARQFTLQGHMRTHTGERPYACPECHATFAQRPHLTKHVSSHHGEERPHCPVCQGRFASRALLAQHMTEEHT